MFVATFNPPSRIFRPCSHRCFVTEHCLCVLRLGELTSDRDGSERVKKAKPIDAVQTSLADRFTQLQDAENAWKKKVRLNSAESLGEETETVGLSLWELECFLRRWTTKSCHMSRTPLRLLLRGGARFSSRTHLVLC